MSHKHEVETGSDDDWGHVHVTRRCCGAATCRNFAPELFAEVAPPGVPGDGEKARIRLPIVPGSHDEGAFTGLLRQPRSKEDYLAARAAAAACGFGAIRLRKPTAHLRPDELGGVWRDWPRRLEDNVWIVGQPSTRNYGALSYFIELPGGGVLVDVPKPSEELYQWLEAHGGVRYLFLSHRDHVQHHAEIAARFPGCQRVIGRADVNVRATAYADATGDVEVKIGEGQGPTDLEGAPIAAEALAAAELVVLPQPGHTPGGLCLLYAGRFLFTGDHLAYSRRLGHVIGHRLQCWEDWERQSASVHQLATWAEAGWFRFQWLLPGHGEWHRFGDETTATATAEELGRAVAWMRAQPPGNVPLLRWIPFVMSRANPRGKLARVVGAIGGEGGEAWLIPSASRGYLTDSRALRADGAARRLYALTAAALAMVMLIVWVTAHALH